jgi:hypothetical protein
MPYELAAVGFFLTPMRRRQNAFIFVDLRMIA